MGSLLARRNPAEAYRRVAHDAAIVGSDAKGLGRLCFDEFVMATSRAITIGAAGDALSRSKVLLRGLSALAGLRLGLDRKNPLAPAFETLFDAAESALRRAMVAFDGETLRRVNTDFLEIRDLMFPQG